MNNSRIPISISQVCLALAFVLTIHQAAAQVVPYTSDANTILLDHFNGLTSATISAYNYNAAPTGTAYPSATPSYSFGTGVNGLTQGMKLNPPIGMPAGSGTYLNYPGGQLLSQTNGTIEFWVTVPSFGTGLNLVQQGQYFNAASGWTFGMSVSATGQLSATAWAAFSMTSGATLLSPNTWTHVAATWGSSGAKLYINGVLVGSDANTGMPASGYSGSILMLLGTHAGISPQIDELRVSNIQRTTFNATGAAYIPTITSFAPSSGSVGTSVLISGSNFNSNSTKNIVYFGAVKAPITSGTSTGLTVNVPTGASYSSITVTDTATGLTTCSSKPFIVTFSSSRVIDGTSFGSKIDFTSGSNPLTCDVGDIDGDGKADLIVANYNSNTVSIFRNTSTSGLITAGSFAARVDFSTGTTPYGVVIGDVDGDGKPDLIVVNYSGNSVSVYRNASTVGSISTSSFGPRIDFTTGSGPWNVALGDFDGDGKSDMVVTNHLAGTISVFRNTGTCGSITSNSFAPKVDFTAGTNPWGITVGDIDGDGKQDFAVSNGGSSSVSVYRNTGVSGAITAGSFAAKVDFTTGTGTAPYDIALGDIDGDGRPDLSAIDGGSGLWVFRNTSTPGTIATNSFAAKVDFATGAGPRYFAIGDLDGDGKPDIAVSNSSSNTISVFRNSSTFGTITSSSLGAKVDIATGSLPCGISISDIDGDGKPGLVVANQTSNSISVLRNTMTVAVSRIVTFQADLTQLLAAGFSAVTDSIVVNGSFNTWSAPHKMYRVGSTSIWQDTVAIVGNAGDTVQFKFKAFPDQKFLNAGWDTVSNRIYALTASNATIPAVQPAIKIKTGLIANDVMVNFRVDMSTAREVYGNSLIAGLKTVWMAGDNLPLQWPINWTYPDTVGYFTRMYDDGTHGDLVAGDKIWSVSLMFSIANYVTKTIQYKFGADFTGVQSLNSGIRYLDNEFANGTNRSLLLNDSTGAPPMTVSTKFGSMALAPSAPTNLAANAISSTQINLTWTASTSGSPTLYRIYRSLTSGGSFSKIDSVNSPATAYNNTGLTGNTTYYYLVYAVNSTGPSPASNQANATTTTGGVAVPSAPGNLTASAILSSQINLSWTASTTGSPTRYRIFRSLTSGSGFAKIDSVSGLITNYSNLGLTASTTYYYLVYAVNAGGQSPASNQASATTPFAAPPGVPNLTGPASGSSNMSTTVTFTWSAGSGGLPTSYRLRVSINPSFTPLAIDDSTILSTQRIASSLAYSTTYYWTVRAQNAGGNSTYSSVFAFVTGSNATHATTTPISFPSNPNSPTQYKMISFPGNISGMTAVKMMGGATPADWILISDNGNSSNYFNQLSASTPLFTGRGYWLVRRGNFSPSYTTVMPPLASDGTYSISLQAGWNIIGNPFNVSVKWSAVQAANGVATIPIYSYSGTSSFPSSTSMDPFVGYYFDNRTAGKAQLKIPYPFPASGAAPIPDIPFAWKVQLVFGSDVNEDRENYIGVSPVAENNLDAIDTRKPPLFKDLGFLYFSRPDWDGEYDKFNGDFRKELGEGQVWEFDVSNPRRSPGKIHLNGVESVPPGYGMALINLDNTTPVDVRLNNEYTFNPVRENTRFKLIVGKTNFVQNEVNKYLPSSITLDQNYPNPFNPSTTIGFALPRDASVRLVVVNILGQEIKTLAEGFWGAGIHHVLWNGDDQNGHRVASGVYFCRFSLGADVVQIKKMLMTK